MSGHFRPGQGEGEMVSSCSTAGSSPALCFVCPVGGERWGVVHPMTGLLQRCKELLYSLSASLLFASLYHGSSGSPQTDAARLSP